MEYHSNQHNKSSNTDNGREDDHPSPADFDLFLPWACSQLQIESVVTITKIFQQEYVSATSDKKKKAKPKPPLDLDSDQEMEKKDVLSSSMSSEYNIINILTVYDSNDNLVQIKFDNNRSIHRLVLKVIGLIIQFQPNLTNITIDKGMDQYSLYEICKFLPYSHITELVLDNTFLKEANYSHILEQPNRIKHLSLARCSINDDALKTIAELLVYPLPSSKSLSILNLSTNRITDIGARYLAESLRSNRQISYLNLADNRLTDCGGEEILNTLLKFPLTFNELLASRSRHLVYLKEKNDLILQIARDLRLGDITGRNASKRKSAKSAPTSAKKPKLGEKEGSLKAIVESKSVTNMDLALLEKATQMAETTMGEFRDPFSKPNTLVDNAIVYCKGNNALCYLNLSFNNLTYVSIQKLEQVLMCQSKMDRQPRGLVNVSIDGNYLPVYCKEMGKIDRILDINLSLHQKRLSVCKKKPSTKIPSIR